MQNNRDKKGESFRHNLSDNPIIKEWCNSQTDISNALKYLIEKEAFENGIRDLSKIIPSNRDEEYFKNLLGRKDINKPDKASIQISLDSKEIVINPDTKDSNSKHIENSTTGFESSHKDDEKTSEANLKKNDNISKVVEKPNNEYQDLTGSYSDD